MCRDHESVSERCMPELNNGECTLQIKEVVNLVCHLRLISAQSDLSPICLFNCSWSVCDTKEKHASNLLIYDLLGANLTQSCSMFAVWLRLPPTLLSTWIRKFKLPRDLISVYLSAANWPSVQDLPCAFCPMHAGNFLTGKNYSNGWFTQHL